MKIGLLSDAHGNVVGLTACLEYFRAAAVERIVFLGDAVGYFPDAAGVIDALSAWNATCLLGNHDAMLTGELELDAERDKVYRLDAARRVLSAGHLAQLCRLQPSCRLTVCDRRLLCVHGSPWQTLTESVYPDSDLARFASLEVDVVFCGHTHRPFVRQAGQVTVVNVGSCGLPRDHGSLLSCAVYDARTGQVQVARLPLDIESLIGRYGDQVHASVVACLRRQPTESVFGTVVKRAQR